MELFSKHRLQMYAGRSHPALASNIASHLGIELGPCEIIDFPNGEIRPASGSRCAAPTCSSCRPIPRLRAGQ